MPADTIELKYTLYGDTGLAGAVGFTDFMRLTQHFTLSQNGSWATGDFNYDGSVDSSDYNLLVPNYGVTLPAAIPATVAPSTANATPSTSTPSVPTSAAPAVTTGVVTSTPTSPAVIKPVTTTPVVTTASPKNPTPGASKKPVTTTNKSSTGAAKATQVTSKTILAKGAVAKDSVSVKTSSASKTLVVSVSKTAVVKTAIASTAAVTASIKPTIPPTSTILTAKLQTPITSLTSFDSKSLVSKTLAGWRKSYRLRRRGM